MYLSRLLLCPFSLHLFLLFIEETRPSVGGVSTLDLAEPIPVVPTHEPACPPSLGAGGVGGIFGRTPSPVVVVVEVRAFLRPFLLSCIRTWVIMASIHHLIRGCRW